jgi:hypothetical protein
MTDVAVPEFTAGMKPSEVFGLLEEFKESHRVEVDESAGRLSPR